jgi:hypothetical protein
MWDVFGGGEQAMILNCYIYVGIVMTSYMDVASFFIS